MRTGKVSFGDVPADTFQAARQIYNLQNVYLLIGDQFENLYAMVDFASLDTNKSSNFESIARLMMVTALQYAELLPDRVASDATRKRIDWKYALRLPVHHPGYPPQAMCAFRQGVFGAPQASAEFERFIGRLQETGLYAHEQQSPLTANNVLETVCRVSRLNQLHMCMKEALTALAAAAPNWLLENMPPYWFTRYKTGPLPQLSFANSQGFEEEALKYGMDMRLLRRALREKSNPTLEALAEVQQMERVFHEQFLVVNDLIQWRMTECAHCAGRHQEGYPL